MKLIKINDGLINGDTISTVTFHKPPETEYCNILLTNGDTIKIVENAKEIYDRLCNLSELTLGG